MCNNRKTQVSLRSRIANTEVRFAFMLVDICRMKIALGDLEQADRALVDARHAGEVIAGTIQTRGGVGTSVNAKLSRLAKEIDAAEDALLELRKAIAAQSTQEQIVSSVAPHCAPTEMSRAATAGG